jgi:hypothetical protein
LCCTAITESRDVDVVEDAEENSVITGSSDGDLMAFCQGSALKDFLVIGLASALGVLGILYVVLLILCVRYEYSG